MDPNRLTIKSRQALSDAHEQATARHHQTIEPEHVLFALVSDPDGVVFPLLHHMGIAPKSLRDDVDEALERTPKVYAQGTQVGLSAGTARLLDHARNEAEALTDDYVSTEHLLLALLEGDGSAATTLRAAGVTRDGVLAALAQVRATASSRRSHRCAVASGLPTRIPRTSTRPSSATDAT